jgi:hypothetical protein
MAGVAVSGRLTGRPGLGSDLRPIQLGRLSLCHGGLDTRYISIDGVEVVRRIFMAVRDLDWGTAPAVARPGSLDIGSREFRAKMAATCFDSDHGIRFHWRGRLTGNEDGTICFSFDGQPVAPFVYARIGLCVLHPPSFAGGRYRARTADGWISGDLTREIAPQLPGDHGFGEPLIPAFDELELYRPDGIGTRLQLEGDLFELEDQRNWADASFKTYSTPLHLGVSHKASPEQQFSQQVVITPIDGKPGARRHERTRRAPTLTLGELGSVLPKVGVGLAADIDSTQIDETGLLRLLHPAHLRVDVRSDDARLPAQLRRAAAVAAKIDVGLELAVTLTGTTNEVASLAELLEELDPRLTRVIVFKQGRVVASRNEIAETRKLLSRTMSRVPLYGGTNILFADLNGCRPPSDGLDGVAFPLVPTVHADDDLSLVESMQMFGDVVQTARGFADQLPLAVTPITLRERPRIDERQRSLLGAVWTAGTAAALAQASTESATYFESCGPGGVFGGDPLDATPQVFPLFHVLADVCGWRGSHSIGVRTSVPLAIDGFAVQTTDGVAALIANLRPRPNRAELVGFPPGPYRLRRLNEESYDMACSQPDRFRTHAEISQIDQIELAPYEVIRLDGAS